MAVVASSQRLLERDVELARLSALLAAALAGSGAVVAIEGPAGIGKTALLDALHGHAAERGVRSLRARGRVLEAEMAFAVARQLMEPVVLSAAPADRRRLLAGPARFGAGALGLPGGAAPDSEFAAVHGLYWLLANLAEHTPLLLTIDDVQWVDSPSLSWLAYLGPRTVELPVLVVMTVREGDPRVRVPAVDAVLSNSAAHRFGLPALSPASAGTLVRRDLGRAASVGFCAACWDLTGGNPLYVRELLAAARTERLPGTDESITALNRLASSAVGASVLARMARMGPDALGLAKAVAVLGSQRLEAFGTLDRLCADMMTAARRRSALQEMVGIAMTGRDALTASELRVARLAAAGRTNREIAQSLFITTKTASAHLSRVYRKLRITRRDQLAEALAGAVPAGSEFGGAPIS